MEVHSTILYQTMHLFFDYGIEANILAAIDANGNLVQWSDLSIAPPSTTLKSKNLIKAVCTSNGTLCLARNGTVYHVSAPQPDGKTWRSSVVSTVSLPFYLEKVDGPIDPKVTDISAGKDHVIAATNYVC
jgi:alpha-tubulin suppressor-like RCC1 family protein